MGEEIAALYQETNTQMGTMLQQEQLINQMMIDNERAMNVNTQLQMELAVVRRALGRSEAALQAEIGYRSADRLAIRNLQRENMRMRTTNEGWIMTRSRQRLAEEAQRQRTRALLAQSVGGSETEEFVEETDEEPL